MRRRHPLPLSGLLLAGLVAACETAGENQVLGIEATGAVVGIAFFDRDGNGRPDPTDAPAPELGVGILLPGARDTTASTTTNGDGIYIIPNVLAGRYRVVVDSATVPDSLEVFRINADMITVRANDTALAYIALSYPTVTVAEARALPAGRKIALEGIALNDWNALGDSTVHLADPTGAIRSLRVAPANIAAGDTIRLLGTTGNRTGQPVLSDVRGHARASGEPPTPDSLGTGAAATASGGARDAALVRIAGAAVTGTRTSAAGDVIVTVNDGSGTLELAFDHRAGFTHTPAPGGTVAAAGVLVPSTDAAARWRLMPRSDDDVEAVYPTVTVAQARATAAGRRVVVIGVALNAWSAFGDSTVHLADPTGAIRALQVEPITLAAGDSVRIVGTVKIVDTQPVLTAAEAFVLAAGVAVPTVQAVTTAQAASAAGGTLDAALARVSNAQISAILVSNLGNYYLTVNDGSGPLEVMLDSAIDWSSSSFAVGERFDVTGVLVARPGGQGWRLKPRSATELQKK